MLKTTAIVLAAGHGKRMKSALPKVLHELSGRSLIWHVLNKVSAIKAINQVIVVLGYGADKVKKTVLKDFPSAEFVYQKDISGTASAVKTAINKVKNKQVLVTCGDVPLVSKKTLSDLLAFFSRRKLACALLTANMDIDNELGRVYRDNRGKVSSIREKVDRKTGVEYSYEVNSGIYLFDTKVLSKYIKLIKPNTKKREYFLTDIIDILYKQGLAMQAYNIDDDREIMGINTKKQLALAGYIMQESILEELTDRGVNIIDPRTTIIEAGVKVGKNSLIYPFTFIEKDVIIGNNCSLGPFIHIRKGTRVKDNTQLGNFLEVNRSVLGKGVKVKHFGYLGDAVIGDAVNIGAGTVIANYDGKRKHKTVIKKGAFIGSDSILIAPVTIGKNAKTGAGSVVTKNVKAKTTVAGVPAKILKKPK